MDEYTRLHDLIDSYLQKDDVLFNGEEISLYDLFELTKERFSSLKEITKENYLVNKINRIKYNPFVGMKMKGTCVDYYCGCDGKTTRLTFEFKLKDEMFTKKLDIVRNVGSKEIYFEREHNKELVGILYEEINETLELLEEYYFLYGNPVGKSNWGSYYEQTIPEEVFELKIQYEKSGQAHIRMDIKKEKDKEGVFKRQWYRRQKLSDYLDDNKDEFLKKIPVHLSDIAPIFSRIVEEKMSLNMPKQKKKVGGK